MWIRTDDDVTTFMTRVRDTLEKAIEDEHATDFGDRMRGQADALAVVEHELRHALREAAPGQRDPLLVVMVGAAVNAPPDDNAGPFNTDLVPKGPLLTAEDHYAAASPTQKAAWGLAHPEARKKSGL